MFGPWGYLSVWEKNLLPDLWKYESFCNGEEQMRSWGLCACTNPCTVTGHSVVMGQGSGGNWCWCWVLGWEATVRAFCHICFYQGHSHSLCMCPSSQTVCSCSNTNKKYFSQGCLCGSIIQFPFWSNVKDIMHLLALSAKYNSSYL